jgi:uncharacterized protein YPO0396
VITIAPKKRSGGKKDRLKKIKSDGSALGYKQLEQRLGELATHATNARAALRQGKLERAGNSSENPELRKVVTDMVGDYHAMLHGVSERLLCLGDIIQKLDGRR